MENKRPQVTIEMEDGGKIVIELIPEVAPNTVNNFIYLIKEGFYDGRNFHRVSPTFMIQGGSVNGSGSGSIGYTIKGEFYANGFATNVLSHTRGVISMARAQANNSASSQFFIMTADYLGLDGNYAAFGYVLSGMDVVDAIASTPVNRNYDGTGTPINAQIIKKVTVETFGVEYPEPEKIN